MKGFDLTHVGDRVIVALFVLGVFIVALIFIARYARVRFQRELAADMKRKHDSENFGLWRYSGLGVGEKNFMMELGCVTDDTLRTRQEAREYCSTHFGAVVHVDDGNRIVTYKKTSS